MNFKMKILKTIELMEGRDPQEDHSRQLRTLEKALEKLERQKEQHKGDLSKSWSSELQLLTEKLTPNLSTKRRSKEQFPEPLAVRGQEHREELETREV